MFKGVSFKKGKRQPSVNQCSLLSLIKGCTEGNKPINRTVTLICHHQNMNGDTEHCRIAANERSMTKTDWLPLELVRKFFTIILKQGNLDVYFYLSKTKKWPRLD